MKMSHTMQCQIRLCLLQHILFDYETKKGLKGKVRDRQVKTVGLEILLVELLHAVETGDQS